MKLYHASPIENKEDILEYGIYSNESDKISNDERLSGSYVFGFNNIADAINFITDNTSDYVIFHLKCQILKLSRIQNMKTDVHLQLSMTLLLID